MTVKLLHNERQNAIWAPFIDDDTFFLSMSALVDRLAHYDPPKPFYIGSLSTDSVQMSLWGFMAYGGAEIFISMPLLTQINNVYDQYNAVKWTADRRIAQCIYLHTVTKLTVERDLHRWICMATRQVSTKRQVVPSHFRCITGSLLQRIHESTRYCSKLVSVVKIVCFGNGVLLATGF